MVSVRSTTVQVYAQENKALNPAVSKGHSSSNNANAHTPTVNAASSLPISDTILQFLMTLKPQTGNDLSGQRNSANQETAGERHSAPAPIDERAEPVDVSVEDGGFISETDQPDQSQTVSPTKPAGSRSKDGSAQGSASSAAALLFDLMKPSSADGRQTVSNTNVDREKIRSPNATQVSGRKTNSDPFAMSQASIAAMFGLSVQGKSVSADPTANVQNDSRASSRHRQQSPDSWATAANTNIWSDKPSDYRTSANRHQILKATFTEAGTYQFG